MSPLSTSKNSAGPHRKPRADVYTVLLVIALIAIVSANVFLYFLGADYDHNYKSAPRVQLRQFDDAPGTIHQLNHSAAQGWTLV